MEKKSDLSSVRDSQGFESPTEHLHCSENKQNDWFLKKEKHKNKRKEWLLLRGVRKFPSISSLAKETLGEGCGFVMVLERRKN